LGVLGDVAVDIEEPSRHGMGDAWLVGGDEREDVAGRHGLLSLRRHDPNHKREGE